LTHTDTPLSNVARSVATVGIEKEHRPVYTDKTLTCADCGQDFSFSESEQTFYAERGFSEPRRCPSCRAARKAERGGASGGGYRGGNYAGDYGQRSSGYSRGPREMHDVICSNCGRPTQVPFKPTSGKPVYCSDCFAARR
jgi:CxxC-x17-CxxC domain-containing protein